MNTRMENKNGSLTRYALACGYIEVRNGIRIHQEHGVLFITRRGDNPKQETALRLKDARKIATRMARGTPSTTQTPSRNSARSCGRRGSSFSLWKS